MRPDDLHSGDRYTVIPRTLIFLTRGEEVLLLRGAPHKRLWANLYNGIGGHIEAGETPYSSALRELREETGLTGVELRLRGVIHVTLPTPPGVLLFVFVGEARGGEVRPSEEGTPIWVHHSELEHLPLVEDLPHLLPRVLAPGPLFFGHYSITPQGISVTFEPPVMQPPD